MSIKAIGYEPVAVYRKPAYGKAGYGFRISNLDEINPVYFETDNLTVTSSASSPLPQQASVTFDGSKDVWMSSGVPGRTVLIDFSPSSLTYDNPVGVQIALNALGLAKDSTVGAIGTNLLNGLAIAQPAVPNMVAVNLTQQPIGTYTLLTMPGNGRLWTLTLAAATSTGGSYSGGQYAAFASLNLAGKPLEILELQIGAGGGQDSTHGDLTFNGLPAAAGQVLQLSVNGGSSLPAGATMRASCAVLYSVP